METIGKILSFFNLWSWPIEARRDYKEWKIIRKACKEAEVKNTLEQHNLRVDNLSRIYTVVTIPQELSLNPNTYWPVIMEKLKPLNTVMAQIGLSELVYPRVERIDALNYLIILEPQMDSLNIKSTVYEIVKWILWYFIIGTTNNILISTMGVDYLGGFWSSISYLLKYLPI